MRGEEIGKSGGGHVEKRMRKISEVCPKNSVHPQASGEKKDSCRSSPEETKTSTRIGAEV